MSPAPPPTRTELRDTYGIEVGELRRHPVGFESECWTDGLWFLKIWRDRPARNLEILEQLDLPVPRPLRTRDGELTATANGWPYAVFPHVAGRGATDDDWAETARALRLLHDHPLVDLPLTPIEEPAIEFLRGHLDHPWIADRADEIVRMVDRLDAAIDAARAVQVPLVLCHNDFGHGNLLLDDHGRLAAILDWDWAGLAPREHDVWIATETPHAVEFLETYGAADLDRTHLEYALLRRAVGDLAARVEEEVDRPGVDTWGFARWHRLDANLSLFEPYRRE